MTTETKLIAIWITLIVLCMIGLGFVEGGAFK